MPELNQNISRWTPVLAHLVWEARGRNSDSTGNWLKAERILAEYRYVDWYLLTSIPLYELVSD